MRSNKKRVLIVGLRLSVLDSERDVGEADKGMVGDETVDWLGHEGKDLEGEISKAGGREESCDVGK